MTDSEMFDVLDRYFEGGGDPFVLWYGDGDFPVPRSTKALLCGGLATKNGGMRQALMRFAESINRKAKKAGGQ